MFSRLAPRKYTKNIFQASFHVNPKNQRGLSAITSDTKSNSYGTTDVAGLRIACKDDLWPTSRFAIVSKAGTRYQPAPGLTPGLSLFAFKNTNKRSALRITRESELLGSQLVSYHTRESIVIEAKFLRKDLPYFADLLAEVISQTKFTTYEYQEQVTPLLKFHQNKIAGNATEIALESAHGIAFHNGLGHPLYPSSSSPISKYLDAETISQFASSAYSKSNLAIVVNGANQDEVAKLVSEFFQEVPSGKTPLSSKASKYYGGEERTNHPSGNSIIIAFPGTSSFTTGTSYKPEICVLAALLGGHSNIKWTKGFSLLSKASSNFPGATADTSNFAYSDAGLLTIKLTGTAEAVQKASFEAFKALKSVAEGLTTKEDLKKAISSAKFRAIDEAQSIETGIISTGVGILHGHKSYQLEDVTNSLANVSGEKLQAVAQSLLNGRATVSVVGDLNVLPYAEEIGFKV